MRLISAITFTFAGLSCSACQAQSTEEHHVQVDDRYEVVVADGGPMGQIPDQFSPQTLRIFEESANRRYRVAVEQAGLKLGYDDTITSQANIVHFPKSNAVKVVTNLGKNAIALQFIGSLGGQQKSVICSSIQPLVFKFAGSKCEVTVIDTFGSPSENVH